MSDTKPTSDEARFFAFFNEVGILSQLSSTMFGARLPKGILVSHFAVLNHLTRVKDGRTPLELARAFQVPKTTMTHSLGVLEKHRLIRLAPNPDDGRSKCVWITEAGTKFRSAAIEGLKPDLEKLAAQISGEKIAAILPILQQLRLLMDSQRPT